MVAMRKALLVVSVAAATVLGVGGGAGAAGPDVAREVARWFAPEADVAHHGHVTLTDGRLDIVLLSENHGPSGLADATFRLTSSAALAAGAAGQELPAGCLWGSDREVLCSTGALAADGTRHETALTLRTVGTPVEVTVTVTTLWNGGATDRKPDNNDHKVLVPATGDPYVF
ncbi:hypothetical protein [Streptomyces sp. SP18CS02]|uniref:hypothetical protein n=1 Tax=Streptomyces sp. SP18CS02 TaxID=3002531 RepID=UPI002E7787D7|nr:hypothetical protein [Streptomyces sp. SP18CS02]MEE1751878.1 hypothetical protein [Streptomyces sp. SP18CS02]